MTYMMFLTFFIHSTITENPPLFYRKTYIPGRILGPFCCHIVIYKKVGGSLWNLLCAISRGRDFSLASSIKVFKCWRKGCDVRLRCTSHLSTTTPTIIALKVTCSTFLMCVLYIMVDIKHHICNTEMLAAV